MDDINAKKNTHGGKREGAGKPMGSLTLSKRDTIAARVFKEKINILPEYENITALEVFDLCMKHYMSEGRLMEAVSCADKLAKYRHAPKAARSNAITDEFSQMSSDDLAQLAGNDLAPPMKKKAA